MNDLRRESEWWWIDYLEDELDPSLEQDLQLLLDHSQDDRDSFENFRLLKQWVRESDPAPSDAAAFDRALDRLRAGVRYAIERQPEIPEADAPWPNPIRGF